MLNSKLLRFALLLVLFMGPALVWPEQPLLGLKKVYYAQNTLDWQGWFTVGLFVITFTALILELLPPDITMLGSASLLVIVGVLKPQEFLGGFAKDVIFTVAMLFVLVRAMEINGMLNAMAKWVLPDLKSSYLRMATLLTPMSGASAFLNNTPIVLAMTPLIRKWSRKKRLSPSKFLIPISFASILGGTCTLIGTSTNIIIDGLLRTTMPEAKLEFFELAKIGIPLTFVGLIYLVLFGQRLLPNREDPTVDFSQHTEEFSGEFNVEEDCPLAHSTVEEVASRYFAGTLLAEIERNERVISAPAADETILPGDRLVFIGDIHQIAELHGVDGLRSLADPHFQMDPSSSHFSEVVISTTSTLVGRTLKRVNFRTTYGASVLAVYRQGRRVPGHVSDIVLQAGDSLILLSTEQWRPRNFYSTDFYTIRHNERLTTFRLSRCLMVTFILVAMVVAAYNGVPMMIASLCAAMACLVTRCISIKEAQKSVVWNLLVLIGASCAFGFALQKTGVAEYFARLILSVVGTEPHLLIMGIFVVTMLCTEFVTNNAAALIMFPIALQMARISGFGSVEATKAIGVTVTIAASCSFLTPIGYQTNTIVYGPGGYRFTDYFKVGAPMSIVCLLLAAFIIPVFWPMTNGETEPAKTLVRGLAEIRKEDIATMPP